MFTMELIGGFNPFEWDEMFCPLCKGKNFTSLSHSGIYCDCCNARFVVRHTAGDPGCAVDCFYGKDESIYAPMYKCKECEIERGLFDWQDKCCPHNLHHGDMERRERMSIPWRNDTGQEYRYLILKTGDYCSGWMVSGGKLGTNERGGMTQANWDAFIESKLGVRS